MIGFETTLLAWITGTLVAFLMEGPREANLILDNPGGPDLKKGPLVRRRIALLAPVVVVCWLASGMGWQGLPAVAIASWGGFVPVHRLTLNLSTHKAWWWLSPKNRYDAWWLSLFGTWPMKRTAGLMYTAEVLSGIAGLVGSWAIDNA